MSTTTPASAAPPASVPASVWLYGPASLIIGLTQGLGNNLVVANIQAVQSAFSATTNEAMWLTAAYTATNITATLMLLKFRMQYGLRLFAKLGLMLFAIVSLAHLFVNDLHSAVALRGVAGLAGAPLGTLAFLYMLEAMPGPLKLTTGLAIGLSGAQLAVPLARLISPGLLDAGLWHRLNLLELALAMICLAIVFLLPITPPPRARVFDSVDIISLPLLAVGLGLISIALSLGRYYWWLEAPWLGWFLASGIAALAVVVMIELNRAQPVLHLRWLSSYDMLAFAGSMLLARFVLAEQTTGTIGFFQNLGLLNDHISGLMWVILAATAAGFACVACVNKPKNAPAIHVVALLLVALGAWLQSSATSLTRPPDVYFSQALVAFGGAIFLPSAVSWSIAHVFGIGPQYMTSYLAVFLASQNIGGLLGSAGLGTLVTYREKFHSNQLVEGLSMADPLVVQRLQQYAASYAHTLADPALRAAEGQVLLGQVATREAYVLAYNDLFFCVALTALAVLGLLLLDILAKSLRRNATQTQTS